jgi:hypothetical protein
MNKSIRNELIVIILFILLLFNETTTIFANIFVKSFALLAINTILIFRRRITFNKNYILIIGIAIFHFVLTSLIFFSNHNYNPTDLNKNIGQYILITSSLLISYGLLDAYKINLLIYYEKIIYSLAVIALIFYAIQIINFEIAKNLVTNIQLLLHIPINETYAQLSIRQLYSTCLIYTINTNIGSSFLEQRNCGFAFEPTAFGAYLLIAVFLNVVINNFKVNKKLLILVVALLTTQSTSAIIGLLFIIIFYYFNNSRTSFINIFLLCAFFSIILFFLNSTVVTSKLGTSVSEVGQLEDRISNQEENKTEGDVILLNRFGSVQYVAETELVKSPIIGNGGMITMGAEKNISIVSGIAEIMARFGIIGLVGYLYLLYKSSHNLNNYFYNYRINIIFGILLFINMFTYNYTLNILFNSFLFLGLIQYSKYKVRNEISRA